MKVPLLIIFPMFLGFSCLAQEDSLAADSIMKPNHVFSLSDDSLVHTFEILDTNNPVIDDTLGLIDYSKQVTVPAIKMTFPIKYSVLNGSLEDDYHVNNVVIIDLNDPSALKQELDILKLNTRKTDYLNELLNTYKGKNLQIVGMVDPWHSGSLSTNVKPNYPVIKELDKQISFIWEGLILVDKNGLIRQIFDISDETNFKELKTEVETAIDNLLLE